MDCKKSINHNYFYSHVNYSVTKITLINAVAKQAFYSHVNYSVTKITIMGTLHLDGFYSHVNYSVTKISNLIITRRLLFKLT